MRCSALHGSFLIFVAIYALTVPLNGTPFAEASGAGTPPESDQDVWAELRRLYERAVKSEDQPKMSEDLMNRAKEEIKKIGTWEYRVATLTVPTDQALEDRLNQLGQDRWECLVFPQANPDVRVVCKRPVRSLLKAIPLSELIRLLN